MNLLSYQPMVINHEIIVLTILSRLFNQILHQNSFFNVHACLEYKISIYRNLKHKKDFG